MHLWGPRSPRTCLVCRRPRNADPVLPAQTRRPEDQGNRWCKSQADWKSQEGWTSGLNIPPVNFPVPAHLGRVDFTVFTHTLTDTPETVFSLLSGHLVAQ